MDYQQKGHTDLWLFLAVCPGADTVTVTALHLAFWQQESPDLCLSLALHSRISKGGMGSSSQFPHVRITKPLPPDRPLEGRLVLAVLVAPNMQLVFKKHLADCSFQVP